MNSTSIDVLQRQKFFFSSWLPASLLTISFILILVRRNSKSRLPPGPVPWPIMGSMFLLSQPIHQCFAKLAKKYGPVFFLRIGMIPTVVVSSAEMAVEVLKKNDSDFSFRPNMTFYEAVSYGYNDLAFSPSNTERFKQLRKICSTYIFSSTKLNVSSAMQKDDLQLCIRKIAERSTASSEAMNFSKVLDETSKNAAFRLLFGQKISQSETDFLSSLVNNVENEYTQINIGDFFPVLKPLDLQGKMKKWDNLLMPPLKRFMEKQLADARDKKMRMGSTFAPNCVVDFVVSLDEEDTVPDILLIGLFTVSETLFQPSSDRPLFQDLVVGGLSTQETTLDWAFAELVRHPGVIKKVQEELDRVVGRERAVEATDLPSLPYVEAVVKETLRLHPPLPIGGPHYNPTASTIGPYTIPAKTTVFVNISAISRDPKVWDEPLQFKPERFLDETRIRNLTHTCSFIPFSAGRRICVASPLVMRYTPHFIASFLQAFDVSSAQDVDMSEKPTGLNIRAQQLILKFTRRI